MDGGCNVSSQIAALPEAARRKPRFLLLLPGLFLFRLPAVQFSALLLKLPPRFTRLSPSAFARSRFAQAKILPHTSLLHDKRRPPCDTKAVRASARAWKSLPSSLPSRRHRSSRVNFRTYRLRLSLEG